MESENDYEEFSDERRQYEMKTVDFLVEKRVPHNVIYNLLTNCCLNCGNNIESFCTGDIIDFGNEIYGQNCEKCSKKKKSKSSSAD